MIQKFFNRGIKSAFKKAFQNDWFFNLSQDKQDVATILGLNEDKDVQDVPSNPISRWVNNDSEITEPEGLPNSVAQWNDLSGKNGHYTQNTSGLQPKINQVTQNGIRTVTADGTDLMLVGDASALGMQDSDYEVITVLNMTGGGTQFFFSGGSTDYEIQATPTTIARFAPDRTGGVGLSDVSVSPDNLANFQIIGARVEADENAILNINDRNGSVMANGFCTVDTTIYLLSRANTTLGLVGSIGEQLIFNRVLTATERNAINLYLADKWGLYYPNANWINSYSAAGQAYINGNRLNKNDVQPPFAITVKTDNAGTSNNDQFTLPLISGGTYDFYTDWGDASTIDNITAFNDAAVTHTFPADGTYNLEFWGTFEDLVFNNGGDKEKLLDIAQFSSLAFSASSGGDFYGCSNMRITATDYPDTSAKTVFTNWFRGCSSMQVGDFPAIGSCDVSSGVAFVNAFNQTNFNPDVGDWLISSGASIAAIFNQAGADFNRKLNWTLPITNFVSGVANCTSFNQDITNMNWSECNNLAAAFNGNGMSTANYDLFLIYLQANTTKTGVTMNFGLTKYTLGGAAEAARDYLIAQGWTITDGGGI